MLVEEVICDGREEERAVDREHEISFHIPVAYKTELPRSCFAISGCLRSLDTDRPGSLDRDGLEGDVDPDCRLVRNTERNTLTLTNQDSWLIDGQEIAGGSESVQIDRFHSFGIR